MITDFLGDGRLVGEHHSGVAMRVTSPTVRLGAKAVIGPECGKTLSVCWMPKPSAAGRGDFFHVPLQFGAGEVPVAVVHRLEFTAVDGKNS